MRKPLRILVVEDDALIGMNLTEVLAGMGHAVCSVETTEAGAVAAAAQYNPDMMVVDVGLRDGSGISAVETISRTVPIPHVFISGNAAKCRTLRPNDVVIEKPFSELELVRGILRALGAAAVF